MSANETTLDPNDNFIKVNKLRPSTRSLGSHRTARVKGPQKRLVLNISNRKPKALINMKNEKRKTLVNHIKIIKRQPLNNRFLTKDMRK